VSGGNRIYYKTIGVLVIVLMLFLSFGVSGVKLEKNEDCDCFTVTGGLPIDEIESIRNNIQMEGYSFTVSENSATQYSIDQLCGLLSTEELGEYTSSGDDEPGLTFHATGLPDSLDWRSIDGGLPPIENQGGCGSCWAFATTGALECAIKIYDEDIVDLSEQYLVSCNTDYWGCQGGFFAHDYHEWKPGKCDNEPGAVLEQYFPYRAQNVPCEEAYPHDYYLDSWDYLLGREQIPSVEAIKQAIYDYGPITCAVFVDSSFRAYTHGIFDSDHQGHRNHAVVLVGWHDDTSVKNGGYWILRNSWGTDWGENGYMKIAYGVHSVSIGACYIDYKEYTPPPPPPEKKYILKLNIIEVTNDPSGGFDPIDPPDDDKGGEKPEWYYRVDLQGDSGSYYENNYNKNQEYEWASEYTWTVNKIHKYTGKGTIVKISIKLMDYDGRIIDDTADICKSAEYKTFTGYYNTSKNSFDLELSDPFDQKEDVYTIEGVGKDNAKVTFKVSVEQSEGKDKLFDLFRTYFGHFFHFLKIC